MSSNSVAYLKLRLGILTSRFRANHPLKACSQCMEQDIRETGWAYWHLKHQFPGVWMCTTHKQQLLLSTLKANGVKRFQWLLPHWSELNPASLVTGETASSCVLLSLAELIEPLSSSGTPAFVVERTARGLPSRTTAAWMDCWCCQLAYGSDRGGLPRLLQAAEVHSGVCRAGGRWSSYGDTVRPIAETSPMWHPPTEAPTAYPLAVWRCPTL